MRGFAFPIKVSFYRDGNFNDNEVNGELLITFLIICILIILHLSPK